MLFKAYRYDGNGYFTEETMVQGDPKDPKNPEKALMPSLCTMLVPTFREGSWTKFVDGAWTFEDHPKTCQEAIDRGMTCISNSPNKHQREIKEILENLVKGDEEHFKTEVSDEMVMQIVAIPPKSEQELYDEAAEEARRKRDQLLSETDYLMLEDYPISAEKKAEFEEYRQALRDITSQAGFPFEIEWPVKPSLD